MHFAAFCHIIRLWN